MAKQTSKRVAKKTTTKKSAPKKVTKKTIKKVTKVDGKSRASGEKDEPIETPKKKKDRRNPETLARIRFIREAITGSEFSIGGLAEELGIAFQRARYFVHAIAKKDGKSVVRVKRGVWILE